MPIIEELKVDSAGIDRLHKFQQDMNKIIQERDRNRLKKSNPFQGSGNVLGNDSSSSMNQPSANEVKGMLDRLNLMKFSSLHDSRDRLNL